MKKKNTYIIFQITMLVVLTSCVSVDLNHLRYYLKLPEKKQAEYQLMPYNSVDRTDKGVYSINSTEFLSAIQNDTVNYKLLIFFTWWCSSSEEFLPDFLKELRDNDGSLNTFFISPDDWVYKYDYLNYADKIGLNSPVYLLDVYAYGEKRNPHYRMHKFISEICDNCDEIEGFPGLILFNRQNEIVFKKTGAVSFDTIAGLVNEQ